MNVIPNQKYYKYKADLTEIKTGESKIIVYQSPLSYKHAKSLIENTIKELDEYEINSIKDITGIVTIPIMPPSPN